MCLDFREGEDVEIMKREEDEEGGRCRNNLFLLFLTQTFNYLS